MRRRRKAGLPEPAGGALPGRPGAALVLWLLLVVPPGCGDRTEDRETPPDTAPREIHDRPPSPGEAPRPPEREGGPADMRGREGEPPDIDVEITTARLRGVLDELVRGPAEGEETEDGWSWFSAETAGTVRSVRVDSGGHAVVDFHDLRTLIPGASSSAGSEALLRDLDGTVFEVPEVRTVEYRMEGSCSLFWEWLQYDCQVVSRPGRSP